jgi:hypothetical protein
VLQSLSQGNYEDTFFPMGLIYLQTMYNQFKNSSMVKLYFQEERIWRRTVVLWGEIERIFIDDGGALKRMNMKSTDLDGSLRYS